MDLTSTIFFSIAGLLLMVIIIVVGVYSYRLENANKQIRTLKNQLKDSEREKKQLQDRLDFIRKRYVITKDGVIK